MKPNLVFLILFALSSQLVFAQSTERKGSISGLVVDAQTLEPLIGVNVIIEKTLTGAATDLDGKFSIPNVDAGIYNLVVRYVGFETKTIPDVIVGSNRDQYLEIKLSPSTIQGQEITVSSGYFSETRSDGIGRVSFSPEELRRSPGAAQDLGRVLNALPSVVSLGETSQDLLVRGGSPSENGNYIDNIPLPNIRHFRTQGGQSAGPLGIVNTELVSDIEFSAGGFSSKYGNHLSSVSDISYRDGNTERFRGDLGVNLAGFVVNLDGPLSDNTTFLVSARRSYLDLIADALDAGGAPSFADGQFKLTHNLNKKNKLIFLNIYGTSLFENDIEEAFDEGFPDAISNENTQNTTGLNWRHLWNSGYTNTSLSYSFRDQTQLLTDVLSSETAVDLDAREALVALRSLSYFRLTPSQSIEFGVEVQAEQNDFDYFIAAERNDSGEDQPDFTRNDEVNGTLSSAFASYSIQLTDRFSTTFGARATYNSYNEDLSLAPRFNSRYQITDRLGLNVAAGVYYQAVPRYLISQNAALADLSSTRADHIIAGIDYLLTDDTKLTIDVYNKEYHNAPVLPETNSIGDRSYILDGFTEFYNTLEDNGRAYSRGVELLIQKKLAVDFYGMVSASFFRTRYKDYTGAWQDREYDNRYLFSVIGGYRPNDLWEVSVRWSILGGRAYTPVDPVASANGNSEVLDIARFNEERYPAYHSLYTRVDRRFFMKKTNLVVFLEVWNAYNQSNVETDYWNVRTQQIDRSTQFNLLPVSGVKFEF